MLDRGPKLWAIVLAGGEGVRLATLTRALYGVDLPKQFATLVGRRSMLQATVDRILPLVPPRRIVVVTGAGQERLARQQLMEWASEMTVLVQPRNLDTGPGLVLPLAFIRSRDRAARVVVLPADHHVARPDALLRAIEVAAAAAQVAPRRVLLIGAEPDRPETDYGWIVAGGPTAELGLRPVKRFHEKPAADLAQALLERGAFWNTFIMVGSVETLWNMSRRRLPEHAARLARCPPPDELEPIYAVLPAASFSREVLERAGNLSLVPLHHAGWTDWGTPRRVFESLAGTPAHADLLRRIAQAGGADVPARSFTGEPAREERATWRG